MAKNEEAISNYLKVILGDDMEPNIVSYILSMDHEEDFEEFMDNLIDKSKSAHINSYNGIRHIIFGKKKVLLKDVPSISTNKHNSTSQPKKEKKKFKNISTYEEQKKKKEGRHPCDCMGQEHDFMNNCLFCGRIHCMEEGPGPCLYCGNMITVKGDENFDAKSRKNIKHKENKVFDDDNDYFKINKKKTGEENKKKMVIALDFATRKVIEGSEEDNKIRERLLKESIEHMKKADTVYKNLQQVSQLTTNYNLRKSVAKDDLVDLLIQMRHKKPAGVEDLGIEDGVMPIIDYGIRVFDEDLMANTDHGLCLSMHQPYASLLVAGVKQHEGRTWPTTHRGRLWIAAAAKPPEEDEILALEQFYRDYYKDTSLKFPKDYPTSCLLGSVYVEDCLDQEAYRKKFPNGESNSPFVLICTNPIILPIFYPIIGKHKIYPLDKELHKCAKLALQHAKHVM
ncbi:activating signal cointegrator 1 [Aethina tumida]|uniref:activating signal cointegrator 1 n=1 Tax=Aethina tumida TaxID=116153 RepID=UPI00096ADDC7|nr:activating signal cointegrator 1 [Aethina tumida]